MDDAERLVRHLEELSQEIEALKQRLAYLEAHRAEVRRNILVMARPAEPRLPLSLTFARPVIQSRRANRPADMQGLRQAAQKVAELGGEVDARQLSDAMGISFDAARLRLARAARRGFLVRVKLGKYKSGEHLDQEVIEPEMNAAS